MKGHIASSSFIGWRRVSQYLLLSAFVMSCGSGAGLASEKTSLNIGGDGNSLSTMRLLAAAFDDANPDITVNVLTSLWSTGGIKAAAAGAIDIGTSARPLSEVERSQGITEFKYGRTPLVFVVPRATRASEVTTAQLVDIYYGKMTAWPSGDRIRLITRQASENDSVTIARLSEQLREASAVALARPGMLFALTDADVAEILNTVPGAFGIMSLSEVIANPVPLKTLALNGIAPTAASPADGSYPLYVTMRMVTGKTPSAAATRFIGFVQSAAGREILVRAGHSVSVPSQTKP